MDQCGDEQAEAVRALKKSKAFDNTVKLFGQSIRASVHAPYLVIEVAHAAVALCGSVELCDLRDVEAVHELLPYVLAEAVPQRHAHPMSLLWVPHRLVQQVSADLTNVLHNLLEDGGEKQSFSDKT